jgi:hypothetical protein
VKFRPVSPSCHELVYITSSGTFFAQLDICFSLFHMGLTFSWFAAVQPQVVNLVKYFPIDGCSKPLMCPSSTLPNVPNYPLGSLRFLHLPAAGGCRNLRDPRG